MNHFHSIFMAWNKLVLFTASFYMAFSWRKSTILKSMFLYPHDNLVIYVYLTRFFTFSHSFLWKKTTSGGIYIHVKIKLRTVDLIVDKCILKTVSQLHLNTIIHYAGTSLSQNTLQNTEYYTKQGRSLGRGYHNQEVKANTTQLLSKARGKG